jgi:heat shock protein HslJ
MNYSINKLPTSFEKMANIQFNNLITNSVQYSGKSFVNYYGGTLKIDEIKGLIIQENNGFSTKMASDESSMKAEYDYFANLAKTTYFEFSGDRLLLYLGDKTNSKTEIMTFIRDI